MSIAKKRGEEWGGEEEREGEEDASFAFFCLL